MSCLVAPKIALNQEHTCILNPSIKGPQMIYIKMTVFQKSNISVINKKILNIISTSEVSL